MPNVTAKIDPMLFNYETTYKSDYRSGEMKPPVFTEHRKKPSCARVRPGPLKDIHTLTDWKAASMPFDLLHQQRPIVGTDPRKVQKPCSSNREDPDKDEVQKTRPRLVMPPAVSMDDIADPRARGILCNDMYTSDMARGLREAVSPYFSVRAPFPGLPAPANPIVLPKLTVPFVSPEWRMETVSWDNKQLRAHCDPTKEFWLRHEPPKCRACDETAAITAHRKMFRKMKT